MKSYKPLLLLLVILAACESTNENEDALITIQTSFGDMKVILFEETPMHKKNFIQMAKSGRYDSTEWHRVIKGFMIQGGDVYSKEGTIEPAQRKLPPEFFEGLYHTKGALAAARLGDNQNPKKLSSSSQFYIVHGKVFSEEELTIDQYKLNEKLGNLMAQEQYDDLRQKYLAINETGDLDSLQRFIFSLKDLVEEEYDVDVSRDFDPERLKLYTTVGGAYHLDGNYTIFGKVVEGLDIIDKIAEVETGEGDQPVESIFLTMEVAMVPKTQITEQYGYEYPVTE